MVWIESRSYEYSTEHHGEVGAGRRESSSQVCRADEDVRPVYFESILTYALRRPTASRTDWRKAENDVRLLLLDLCGIALCHPASPPALLNAAIGIQLYGDFFTDRYERQALRGVVEKYRDARAWPVQQLLEMFKIEG